MWFVFKHLQRVTNLSMKWTCPALHEHFKAQLSIVLADGQNFTERTQKLRKSGDLAVCLRGLVDGNIPSYHFLTVKNKSWPLLSSTFTLLQYLKLKYTTK